jgi:hypothetical protein
MSSPIRTASVTATDPGHNGGSLRSVPATPRQFKCTRLITAAQVTRVIQAIPGFREREATIA